MAKSQVEPKENGSVKQSEVSSGIESLLTIIKSGLSEADRAAIEQRNAELDEQIAALQREKAALNDLLRVNELRTVGCKKRKDAGVHKPKPRRSIESKIVDYLFDHGPRKCALIATDIKRAGGETKAALESLQLKGIVTMQPDGSWKAIQHYEEP